MHFPIDSRPTAAVGSLAVGVHSPARGGSRCVRSHPGQPFDALGDHLIVGEGVSISVNNQSHTRVSRDPGPMKKSSSALTGSGSTPTSSTRLTSGRRCARSYRPTRRAYRRSSFMASVLGLENLRSDRQRDVQDRPGMHVKREADRTMFEAEATQRVAASPERTFKMARGRKLSL